MMELAPLPPGQSERKDFPRFGVTSLATRFPKDFSRRLEVTGEVERSIMLPDALSGLTRIEQVSDFHCVTTWSYRNLRWGGVHFREFYERAIVPLTNPNAKATLVALRAQDGARTALLLEDLLEPDVLLADSLNGEPLTMEHGAPLRLVAPRHFGYKSVKHLSKIEFRRVESGYRYTGFRFMDHLRARVEFEERGRGAPGWLLRRVYRPLVPMTVREFQSATNAYYSKHNE
jgi:DMSO/TMAO reductase YedYZ molybdopterin-dependent catalytic subunit